MASAGSLRVLRRSGRLPENQDRLRCGSASVRVSEIPRRSKVSGEMPEMNSPQTRWRGYDPASWRVTGRP